jgi:two-component SAPR family response regulator
MIRTILVDDEAPALLKLKNLLLPYAEYTLCGEYTDANEALMELDKTRPQVAFLDVAMPSMNGMDLALAIQQRMGGMIQIVFVSAYDEYALTAFEVHATDYLLKPVTRARFKQTIERLNAFLAMQSASMAALPQAPAQDAALIRTFGKLEIARGERRFGSWRTAKVRELFAFFVHNRGQRVYRETILETLWGHMDADHALSSMNTCNYYLRKHLEETGTGIALTYSSSYYTLQLDGALCDADLFHDAVALSRHITPANLGDVASGATLYRGEYFEDVKCEWADLDRKRFSSDYTLLRTALTGYYLNTGNLVEAESNAIAALDENQLNADAWKALMAVQFLKDDPAARQAALDKMVATYRKLLNADPPAELMSRG